MTERDILTESSKSLREQFDGHNPRSGLTRARVMRSTQRGRKRQGVFWILVPAVVLFGGTTAWAAATGRLPQIIERVSVWVGVQSSSPTQSAGKAEVDSPKPLARTGKGNSSGLPLPGVQDAPVQEAPVEDTPAEDAPVEGAPTEQTLGAEAPPQVQLQPAVLSPSPSHGDHLGERSLQPASELPARPRIKPSRSPVTVPQLPRPVVTGRDVAPEGNATTSVTLSPPPAFSQPPELEPAPDPELALFRDAHQAHFGGAGPAAAIAAYQRYLNTYPGGRFVPEARYNVALSLVKLGRHGEARRALQPFAQGKYAGYRKREAKALLRALDGAGGASN